MIMNYHIIDSVGIVCYAVLVVPVSSLVGINTITIVNNNGALGQCWVAIKDAYKDKPKKEEMCMFSTVSFAKVAESLGCIGMRAERPEEISALLKTALKADRPVVIEVITDPNCKAPDAGG